MSSSLGGGVGGSGGGMEVPLVRESDKEGDRGPMRKDSADSPIRGTDLRLIGGPALDDMLYKSQRAKRNALCVWWHRC